MKDQRYLTPENTAALLNHLFWQEFEAARMTAGWVPSAAKYDIKVRLGRFSYLHNRHAQYLYHRISELPGGTGENDWTPELTREAFDRISMAPDLESFFSSYHLLIQSIYMQYDELLQRMDPILNSPTVDQIRLILIDRRDMTQWVEEQMKFSFADDPAAAERLNRWEQYTSTVWALFMDGSLNGKEAPMLLWPSHPTERPAGPVTDEPLLEERFPIYTTQAQGGATAYSDPDMSPLYDSVKQMVYINATEIAAAESMVYLYYGVERMPMQFYFDLARHMWDEFRHSQMGIRRLEQFGYKTEDFLWNKGRPLLSDVKSKFADMYSTLTMVAEACSFTKKRKAVEAFYQFKDSLSAVQSEFDIIDERAHVDFGTKWGPELYKQIGDVINAATMAEKARKRRLQQFNDLDPGEFEKIAKHVPSFCAVHTNTLAFDRY